MVKTNIFIGDADRLVADLKANFSEDIRIEEQDFGDDNIEIAISEFGGSDDEVITITKEENFFLVTFDSVRGLEKWECVTNKEVLHTVRKIIENS